MMMKLKQQIKLKEKCGIFVVWFFVALILIQLYGNEHCSLKYPLSYSGGDETSYMSEVKMMLDDSTWYETDKLGAPFGTNRNSLLSYNLFHDVHLLSFLFVKITNSVPMAVNLTYIVLIFLIAGISYAVIRSRKVKMWIAVLGSLVFTFQSYLFYRNVGHMMLSAYEFVPLAILLSLWVYEDDDFLMTNVGKKQKIRNILAVIFAFLIGNNGMGYYSVFACFFVMIAGLSKSLQTKNIRGFIQAVKQVILIIIGVGISLLYFIVMRLCNNGISLQTPRSLNDIEIFSLKISRLLIPIKSTGLEKIDTALTDYATVALAQTETTEFLGLVGGIGFIILLLVLFCGISRTSKYAELKVLSLMNVSALLYATVGGFGVFLFLFVTNAVRASNRISIYIAFISILAVCILLSKGLDCLNEKLLINKSNRVMYGGKCISYILITCVFAASLYVQMPYLEYNNQQAVSAYQNDEKFISDVESSVPADSMIFQLPCQVYLAGGVVNKMMPDQLFMPYLHSDNLRWSYGSFMGEDSQRWSSYVAGQNVQDMLDSLAYMGFAGVYIDTRAYTNKELKSLKKEIKRITQQKPMVDENKTMLFYNLSSYTQKLKDSMTEAEWNSNYEKVKNYR